MARAYLLYSQAAALAPQQKIYWLRSQAVRTRAALQSKISLPASESDSEDADEPEPSQPVTPKELRESRKPGPPTELKPVPGRKDLNLKAAPKDLFEQAARAFGLDVVFDGDYPDSGNPIVFRMEQADYREALHSLETATSSFVIPIGERLFMVAKDTQQKRNDVEPAVTVVIPIPQATTVQEAQEVARAVQQVMEIKRFGIDSARRLVILNGPISKVRPAQKLFEDLLTYRPEVRVDLEFIEVNRTDALNYGLTLPTSFSITPLTTVLHNAPALAQGLSYVLFGGGASLFAIGVSNAQVSGNGVSLNGFTGSNYSLVLGSSKWHYALGFTVIYTLITVVVELVLGTLIALVLERLTAGRGLMMALLLIPWSMITVINAELWGYIYQGTYGVANAIIGAVGLGHPNILGTPTPAIAGLMIADIWKTTPFVAIIVLAGLVMLPGDIYEAAEVDGSSDWSTFWRITVPLLRPTLALAVMFRVLQAFGLFDLPWVLTNGGPGTATMVPGLDMYQSAFQNDQYGYGMAIGTLLFVAMLIFTLIVMRALRPRTN